MSIVKRATDFVSKLILGSIFFIFSEILILIASVPILYLNDNLGICTILLSPVPAIIISVFSIKKYLLEEQDTLDHVSTFKFNVILEAVLDIFLEDRELSEKGRRLLSFLFLCVPVIMSISAKIPYDDKVFGFLSKSSVFTFYPDLNSSLISVALISPLYLRNIFSWKASLYSIFSCMMIVFIFASLVQLILGGNQGSPWLMNSIVIAVTLSWLGTKGIAGIAWLVVMVTGLIAGTTANAALGFLGYIYVITAFLGMILNSNSNPGSFLEGLQEGWR
jgi:hypothetical protein